MIRHEGHPAKSFGLSTDMAPRSGMQEKTSLMGPNLSNVVGWTLGGNVVVGFANFLSMVWFARALGPQIMGVYAALLVAFQLLTALLTPGFNQAIIRTPSKQTLTEAATFATFVQSLVIVGASGVVCGIALLTTEGRVADLLIPGIGMLVSTVLSLWVYLLAAPFEAVLEYRRLVRIRIIALFVSTLIGVVAVERGFGLGGLVVRDVMSSIISIVFMRLQSPFLLAWRRWREGLPDLIRFTRGLWPLNILERLALRVDYAVVGLLFDIEMLGIYFAVRGILEGALGFALSPIQTVLYSYYCRLPNIKNVVDILFRRDLILLVGLMTAGAILLLHVMGDWLIAATLGPQYRGGSVLLGGLVLYAASVTWFEHIKVLAMSQDSHHSMVLARIVQLGLSVALVFPLVNVLGLMGAALSTGIAAASMAVMSTWFFTRAFPIASSDLGPEGRWYDLKDTKRTSLRHP